MLRFAAVVWILFAAPVWAQSMPQGMPQGMPGQSDMQKMMLEAQRMATCMEDIDQGRLEELGREAQTVSAEIESLCAAEKESEALRVAMNFARALNADPTVQQVRACSEGMGEMVADMLPQVFDESSVDESGGGICE